MIYVVGAPVKAIMDGLTQFLQGMGSTNVVILGLILGSMMAVDMGGPVNKAAYTFAVGLLTSDTYIPMAAVMAAGMTPPLGIAIATLVGSNRFTQAEREAGKAAGVLGLSFITEGAIPFAAKDPLRVIPSLIIGSATAGALSMYFGVGLHGGKQEGVRVIDIDNGVMQVTLVPTRGMGIQEVKSGDLVFGWSSPVKEIVNPAYIELESRNGLGWLAGIEPGTSYAYNRKYQRDLGLVPTIEAGESKQFDLTYTLLDSANAVKQATEKVDTIQDKQPSEVRKAPLVKLPEKT